MLFTMLAGFVAGSVGMGTADSEPSKALPFRHVTVDSQVGIGYGVAVADIDGDSKLDIVLADKNVLNWYKNSSWEKHVIAEKLTDLDHVCLAARDIDGDGKADLAAGAGWTRATRSEAAASTT